MRDTRLLMACSAQDSVTQPGSSSVDLSFYLSLPVTYHREHSKKSRGSFSTFTFPFLMFLLLNHLPRALKSFADNSMWTSAFPYVLVFRSTISWVCSHSPVCLLRLTTKATCTGHAKSVAIVHHLSLCLALPRLILYLSLPFSCMLTLTTLTTHSGSAVYDLEHSKKLIIFF